MWVCLKEGFLSIVHKDCAPDELLVRARVRSHITRYFPEADVIRTPHADYLFRTVAKRDEVSKVISDYVMQEIQTGNFKESVQDWPLHDAYTRVWYSIARMQEKDPWAGDKT